MVDVVVTCRAGMAYPHISRIVHYQDFASIRTIGVYVDHATR
jgi:hypothetical protein